MKGMLIAAKQRGNRKERHRTHPSVAEISRRTLIRLKQAFNAALPKVEWTNGKPNSFPHSEGRQLSLFGLPYFGEILKVRTLLRDT